MNQQIKQIVIVGGGTAGWLTAGILAAEFSHVEFSTINITLIESPDVKTIGVGEGTWPTMRDTIKKMGISEADFIRDCSATFKQGSKFVGWKNGLSSDVYYHPFTIPQGYPETNIVAAWQAQYGQMPFAEAVCLQSVIAEYGLAPKQVTTPEYAGVLNYGYHLDAGKFAELLQKHCTQMLGVKHLVDHVVGVNSTLEGDIASLLTKNSAVLNGDLFIDCTGTNCLLLGEHFGIPFCDKSDLSINNCALAAQVPYVDGADAIASPTISTALSAGWTWDIGLSSRRGVGYVYSSAHIEHDAAERELRTYLAKSIGVAQADKVTARRLEIRAGHREVFWHKNCVAVGMAAGFIEPLEASALALVELSVNMIRDELPMTRATMDLVAKRFNRVFHYRWERIIDFLRLHYALTQRTDSDYWRDQANHQALPESLCELLSLWEQRPPSPHDFMHSEEIFPTASYLYVLYGMGFVPKEQMTAKTSDLIGRGLSHIKDSQDKINKYRQALPINRDLINHIHKNGMHKI